MNKIFVAALVFAALVSLYFSFGGVFKNSSDNVVVSGTNETDEPMTSIESHRMKLTITAFRNGESIPSKFTCDGTDISPRVEWSGVPEGAQSLVLIMEDPDVPKNLKPDGIFVHWILYSIPANTRGIPEGDRAGSMGVNSAGETRYTGPCPPPQYEPSEHRYIFTLYALDIAPSFAVAPEKDAVVAMMQGHIVAQAQYTGRYKRQ